MVLDQDGVVRYSNESANISAITQKIDALLLSPIEKPEFSIQHFELFENYPNPFNPQTQISFNLDKAQDVSLRIFDIQGRLIRTLTDSFLEPGTHTFRWNGTDSHGQKAASGIYLYQLRGESTSKMRRMILLQ